MTGPMEDRLQRLEDLAAIQQLFIDYGEHLDSGDFEAYAQLFAEDGEVLLGAMGRAKGRGEIKALMQTALAGTLGSTFHIVSSPRVVMNGDRATTSINSSRRTESGISNDARDLSTFLRSCRHEFGPTIGPRFLPVADRPQRDRDSYRDCRSVRC